MQIALPGGLAGMNRLLDSELVACVLLLFLRSGRICPTMTVYRVFATLIILLECIKLYGYAFTQTIDGRENGSRSGRRGLARIGSDVSASKCLDSERRNFLQRSIIAPVVSSIALFSPLVIPPTPSEAVDNIGSEGNFASDGGIVMLKWDDEPIGKFPVAIDGVSNVAMGTTVLLSYIKPPPSSSSPQVIVYQRTGSADERRLEQAFATSGEQKNIARALDIGNRIGDASGVLEGIKTSTVLSTSKRGCMSDAQIRDEGYTCNYYDFDLLDDATKRIFVVSAVVVNRRLYVATFVCDEDVYRSNAILRDKINKSRSSFQVELLP